MLDYARERAVEALATSCRAVLATSGPAGVQAGEFRCEARGLDLYLLVPRTSDHLFNLEHDAGVTLLAVGWELKGEARVVSPGQSELELGLLREAAAEWSVLVRVRARRLQIRRPEGWGPAETLDFP